MLEKEDGGVSGAGSATDSDDAITKAMSLLDTMVSEHRPTLDRLMQLIGNGNSQEVLHSMLQDETGRQVVIINKQKCQVQAVLRYACYT